MSSVRRRLLALSASASLPRASCRGFEEAVEVSGFRDERLCVVAPPPLRGMLYVFVLYQVLDGRPVDLDVSSELEFEV